MADIKPGTYAASVVEVLAAHFPDLANPVTAAFVTGLIKRQARNPQPGFEVIVDNPASAKWRLKPDREDRRRVRVAYFPVSPPGSPAGNALELIVNDALRELDAEAERMAAEPRKDTR